MSRFASLFIENESPTKKDREATNPQPEYTILFVDDEPNVLKAMHRIFRQENYRLLTAASGTEALTLLKDHSVQVIISDHRMPGMTGADLLRKIKALYPETIRIMLTGHADVNAIMGAINEGAVYKFITKPWSDEDLRLTVSLALEQYDLIQENRTLKKQRAVQEKKIHNLRRFVDVHRSQVGRMLLKKGLLDKDQLKKAHAAQARTNKILPLVLTEMGLVSEKVIIKTIESELGVNRVYPNEFTVPGAMASLIPREVCEKNIVVPLKRADRCLIVAMADPSDYIKVDDLKFLTGIPVQPVLATSGEILDKLKELYGEEGMLDAAMSELDMQDPTETIEIILEEEDEASDIEEILNAKDQPPAIRIVNAVISDALRHQASDVHIEPKAKYTMVRYRIDGLLQDKLHIPLTMHPLIVSRIKIMSELDISERRKPQDGRVTVKSSSRMVDMRISTLPTVRGEKMVLRILDKEAAIKGITSLGFSDTVLERVSRFIELPQGIVLATGPTGSGKTSTLYSLLQHGATVNKNFTTIEEPVEYFMGMAEQVNVRPKIGLDFPVVLRALLRQDPDVILLGEIRDFETAEVAFHAALTGHLVLSTLHTNGTVASITRLKDMGVKSYVISDALTGIISQRLVRKICTHCRTADNPDPKALRALKLSPGSLDFSPKKGAGCEHCNGTGYNGRIGIFEVFPMDEELKKMIHKDATETELMTVARRSGMKSILEDAVDKIRDGITTCEEVLRVLGAQNMSNLHCPNCKLDLEEISNYCPFCGNPLMPYCHNCGRPMNSGWKSCPSCGRSGSRPGI